MQVRLFGPDDASFAAELAEHEGWSTWDLSRLVRLDPEGCLVGERVMVGKGTRLVDSELRGPCLIGRNCVIRNSTVGPYVALGDGCEIYDSTITESVIQSNCKISQLPSGLQGSVLGEQVQITGDGRSVAPLQMILGDMAQIRVF